MAQFLEWLNGVPNWTLWLLILVALWGLYSDLMRELRWIRQGVENLHDKVHGLTRG